MDEDIEDIFNIIEDYKFIFKEQDYKNILDSLMKLHNEIIIIPESEDVYFYIIKIIFLIFIINVFFCYLISFFIC